jgi:hypothetical protein
VVDWAGEHAGELRLSQTGLDGVDLRFGVADGRVVVLGGAELEVFGRLAEIALEPLRQVELALDLGALSKQRLSLGLVVPEGGRTRLLVQLGESSFQFRDVKDAPLAPTDAF